MRLLTFQDKKAVEVLDDGKWYSKIDRRVKCIDYDYYDEDTDSYPIYTYASFGKRWTPCFGLRAMYSMVCDLVGYMYFELENYVMLELEVPEDFILNMKKSSDGYQEVCEEDDPDREMRHRGKWYKRASTLKDFYTSDYLKVVRAQRGEREFEALIPYLDKEHVVAIRDFSTEDGGYGTYKCTTIYINDKLCPLWYGTIYMNGDGYPRFDEKEDADIIGKVDSLNGINIAQGKYGAKVVLPYFTIEEALACANKELFENIRQSIKMNNWSKEDIKYINMLGERV